jgi:hypothetical protein
MMMYTLAKESSVISSFADSNCTTPKSKCMVFDPLLRTEYPHDVERIDEDYSEIEQNQR